MISLAEPYLENKPKLKAAIKHGWTVIEKLFSRYLVLENDNDLKIGYFFNPYSTLIQERFYGDGFKAWCHHCKDQIQEDDEDHEHEDGTICESCYDELTECYICESKVWETTTIDGHEYCDSCAEDLPYCDYCERRVSETRDVEGHEICDDCYENNLPYCVGCSSTVWETDEDGRCPSCQEDKDDEERVIHDYGYQPRFEFRGKGPIFFGIELEVKGEDSVASGLEDFIDGNNYLYCKEDSSIIGGGFEIVSHPADWEWLTSHKKEWNKLLQHLKSNQMTSYDAGTCGLHIHVSRNPLGPLTKYKIQKLIYENSLWWRRVANRNSEYASFTSEEPSLMIKKAKGANSPDRRVAVNFPNDLPTIEFRLFKGTLCAQSFWRKLESVHACVIFCKENSIRNIKVGRFIDWITSKKKDYPELWDWIKGVQTFSAGLEV